MIEKLDIEIESLEEGLEMGSVTVGARVALGQHTEEDLVAVSSIDHVPIGTFNIRTLNTSIDEITQGYDAEIRSVRRSTAGQPNQVVVRVRKKSEEAGPVPEQVRQEEGEEVDLLSRRQLSLLGSNTAFRDAFREPSLRAWADRVAKAPDMDREAIVSQALADPRCGAVIESLMDQFVENESMKPA